MRGSAGSAAAEEGQEAALVTGIIGAFAAYCTAEKILHSCFWTAANVTRLAGSINNVIDDLSNDLK